MTIKTTIHLLALAGLAALATVPAADAAQRDLPYITELDTCISAIYRRIDVDGAERVRHIVRDAKSVSDGYELTIDTVVFDARSTRAYASVCMTRGGLAPMKLEIEGDTA